MVSFEIKKLIKWLPVVAAGLIASYQAVTEQKEQERIDDMESRIAELERKEES